MLLEIIGEIHRASRRTYGARRIHAELVHGRGLQVARWLVELVMRRNGLAGLPGRHRTLGRWHTPMGASHQVVGF